jgi:hypothetical protein
MAPSARGYVATRRELAKDGIKDYDRLLKAFDDGEINRLVVVVPSLSSIKLTSQSATQS